MTENKQIMIDGVDVSKCADYDEDAYFTCQACNVCKCSELPNCYFKQLARKTQECEELRTDIKDIANLLDLDTGEEYNFGNIEIAIKGLKQECERWKSNFNGKVSAIEELLKQLDQLKAKSEELERDRDYYKRIVDGCPDVCENGFCQIDFENKRLKTENKQLKNQIKSDKGLITNAGKQNYQLIQEYDRLKTKNEEYQLFIEKLCEYAGLECDSEEQAIRTLSDLTSQMNKARWTIDRYKQALTEIKQIAEENIRIADLEGLNGVYRRGLSKQIIQKCEEIYK